MILPPIPFRSNTPRLPQQSNLFTLLFPTYFCTPDLSCAPKSSCPSHTLLQLFHNYHLRSINLTYPISFLSAHIFVSKERDSHPFKNKLRNAIAFFY